MNNKLEQNVNASVEISIRLIFLFILVGWCMMILLPFTTPVIWAVIIAVSVSPIYDMINSKLSKSGLSSTIIVLIFLLIIIVPSYFLVGSVVGSIQGLVQAYEAGGIEVPPPNDQVKEWPLIGEKAFAIWDEASDNLQEVIVKYDTQVASFGKWLINTAAGLTMGILQFILSIIIAGVLLATKGTKKLTYQLFTKLVGSRGEEFADLSDKTIKNVTKGILGVAIIQSILLGLLFVFAGVPYAGIWALLVLVLGIIQLPPTLVSIPVIIWLYSATSPGSATIWTVLIILASLSDNILKPILLGKGAAVPMLVIFLGAIGGFILSGFLGLFTGAIMLSLGYKLFIAWIEDASTAEESSTVETSE